MNSHEEGGKFKQVLEKNYFYHIRIQNIIENHFKIKTKCLKGNIVRQLLHECNLQYKSLLLFTNVLFLIIFIP